MKTVVGLLLVIVAVGLVVAYGCGPQAGVAQDKIVAQIDKVLGEMDVQKKKIEQEYGRLKAAMEKVHENRIGTEVRLENLKKKKANSEAELAVIKGQLERLVVLIAEVKEKGEIERNGKKYSAEDLNETAKEYAEKYKAKETELESNLGTSISAMQRSLDFLLKQEAAGKAMLDEAKKKMEEIDSRTIAMDAVKSATGTVGGQTAITDKFKSLNTEIEDLFVKVETAMRVEESKLNEMDSHTSAADALLAEPTDLDATSRMLEGLLGKSAGDDK